MEFFTEEDAADFFGRDSLTDELLNLIKEKDFLAVLGASGSGKSSVLRAGLIYQLKQGIKLSGSTDWKIIITRPTVNDFFVTNNPLENLAVGFVDQTVDKSIQSLQLTNYKQLMSQGAKGLISLVQLSKEKRILLIIDQFEEIFTFCTDKEQRDAFFECLLETIKQTNHKLCVIVSMRIDFFGKCFEETYHNLGQKINNHSITVTSMNKGELTAAIVEPLKPLNVTVEDALIKKILQEVANSQEILPLVEDTLTELWKQQVNHTLTLKTYHELGGIGGTLNKRATAVYNQLTSSQQSTAKHIFVNLTRLGENTEDTRRRVTLSQLITPLQSKKLVEEVIKILADNKLIVTSVSITTKGMLKNNLDGTQVQKEGLQQLQDGTQVQKEGLQQLQDGTQVQKEGLQQLQDGTQVQKKGLQQLQDGTHIQNKGLQSSQLEPTIEIIHEALIRNWELLKEWLNENRELLLQQRRIETAAYEWRQQGEKREYLWQGRRLKQGLRFQKQYKETFPLSEMAIGFLQAGVKQRRRERVKGFMLLGIFPLIGTMIIFNEMRLIYHSQTLARCTGIGSNCSGRIEALEALVKARRDLKRINLEKAYLRNTNLSNADLRNADLSNADLSNADLWNADLWNTDLSNANLSNTNLIDANLYGANLSNAYLRNANLSNANLWNAYLSNANLWNAYLGNANLSNTNLWNADLSNAKNLTPTQIKSACYWEKVIFKGYVDREQFKWIVDEEANQAYINELKADKASDPDTPPDCD
ncbi:MAG: pentapeptide repeat-containing protein [Microcystaceae cyanobacterium]